MNSAPTWNFDEYDWVDDRYDERMSRPGRLCYSTTRPTRPAPRRSIGTWRTNTSPC